MPFARRKAALVLDEETRSDLERVSVSRTEPAAHSGASADPVGVCRR